MSFLSPPSIVVEDETNREAIRFTLKWSIQQFEALRDMKHSTMYSPGITMAELGMDDSFRGRWRIRVTPCLTFKENNAESEKDYTYAELCLTDENLQSTTYTGKRALSLVFKQSLTTGKLKDVPVLCTSYMDKLRTYSSDGNTAYGHVISHQDLFGSREKAGSLKDSCLHFSTDAIIYTDPKTMRASEAVSPSLLQRYQEFLGRLLQQHEAGGDFLLISSDRQEFRVDRCLLMAHSPVFAAMLNHDSKEKQTSRCEMEDVDGECVKILLDYVYGCETGKVRDNNAEKVLAMADKYQMLDLRAVCELTLASSITEENAVNIFALARQRNLGTLKDLAVKFIRKNMDVEAVLDTFDI